MLLKPAYTPQPCAAGMAVSHSSQGGSACLPSMIRACAEVQEMLAVARPLDLTQNIFQDGQWGTLRYVPSQQFSASH